jgi:serine/threonine protein kinase
MFIAMGSPTSAQLRTMSETGNLAVGTRIGSFRVVGHLVGNIYRAVQVDGPGRVLIEIGSIDNWRDTMREMMRAQRLVEALEHPGVARIVDRGILADHRPWIATEVPHGLGLYEVIARRALPPPEVTALIRDVADVLAYAHARGIIHRALTLRSIVMTVDRPFPLCVADWGLRVDDLGVFGAPELSMGGSFDGRVDVYALGVIAFRAVSRRFPGEGGIYDVPDAPTGLATLVARMLAISPSERPIAAEVRAIATELIASGDDVIVSKPRFSKPRWTPSPDVSITSERAPTAAGEISDTDH